MAETRAPFPLGAFDLFEPVASGGMADVWRGEHREQRVPVAIKVLTAATARDAKFVAWFRNEARLVAGLDHPHVVAVFDFGVVPAAAAAGSGDRLVSQSPYLVMEWASGGTLRSTQPASWSSLRECLSSLLDALAHAHARGVLHLDVKPGNVLRCIGSDLRPGLKLADFGIGRLDGAEEEGTLGTFIGTPAYVAPEQALGRREELGPWTDLYSLGCLAYRMATGEPPFHGDADTILAGHLTRPPPPLRPLFAVPRGLAEWLDTLLQKEPALRFECAADAARFIERLPVDGDRRGWLAPRDPQALPAEGMPPDETIAALGGTPEAMLGLVRGARRSHGSSGPRSWRQPSEGPARRSMRLVGAGLGIYGLRTVPLVGRVAEREILWSALRELHVDGRARAVALEGPSGCGKSRLATWLSERAGELGAANALRAMHTLAGSSADGLAAMLGRHFRCVGITEPTVAHWRIVAALRRLGLREDEGDAAALAELVAPTPIGREGPLIRFGSSRERHEVIARYLARLTMHRPAIVWLDDVQWGSDGLAFAQHLLDAQDRAPSRVLVVLTARSEALSETRIERRMFEQLVSRSEVEHLRIGPLPDEQWAPFVGELLGLEGELALRVEERAAGNPLFAIQLVGDWVERGLLVPGHQGFELRRGTTALELPRDLDEVWLARIELLLADRTEEEERALEIAAALGREIVGDEWRAACALSGIDAPRALVEALLVRHLAATDRRGPEVGWWFVHGLLRESIERRARESGRQAGHHRAIAAMIDARGGPGAAERVGRHLFVAGDHELAAQFLLEGARERMRCGEYRFATALLSELEEALRKARVPETDRRWCEAWIDLSLVEGARDHLDQSERHAVAAEAAARRLGFPSLLAGALVARARVDVDRGRAASALSLSDEAVAIYDTLPPGRELVKALLQLGNAALYSKAWDRVRGALERAEAIADLDDLARAEIYWLWTFVSLRRAEWANARAWAERALVAYDRAGSRAGIAGALNALGEAARAEGDLQAATDAYRRSHQMSMAVGAAVTASVAEINLALVLLANRDHRGARQILEKVLPPLERAGRSMLVAPVRVGLLASIAGTGDWAVWNPVYEAAIEVLRANAVHDPDVVFCARLAGELAASAGETERAREAYELALEHAEALQLTEATHAIASAIASLSG